MDVLEKLLSRSIHPRTGSTGLNALLGTSSALTIKHHMKGNKKHVVLQAPASQKDCVKYFSAVDCNDRDSSEYLTSICTNCWYLRLVFI